MRTPPSQPSAPLESVIDAIDRKRSSLKPFVLEYATATPTAGPRVCVIAEIGVNHDGRLDRALELVDAAARAGADAIKLQLFDPRDLLSNQARLAVYQQGKADDVFEMLDALKLAPEAMLQVRHAARERGLGFIVTPFSLDNFDALASLDVDAVKIASPDAVNFPLLRRMATLGRPMLISTGTAEIDELAFAADLIRSQGASVREPGGRAALRGHGGALLQCVSSYPTPAPDAGLGGIRALADRFDLAIGYSDHTTELHTGALAVAAGACVIEKHLTYDRTAKGPDHAASFNPKNFGRYVAMVRQAALMLGPFAKNIQSVETDVRSASRQSLCATRDLPAGHVLTPADLTIKRPGTGIPAANYDQVIGRRLERTVRRNDLLNESDLAA